MSDPVSAATAASAVVATTAANVGLFAAIGGFIAGWAILILVALFVLGIFSEHNESSGWTVFFVICAAGVVYMTFSLSWIALGIYSVGYIVLGLGWSVWRYKRHAKKIVAEYKDADAHEKKRQLRMLHPTEMLGTITAWILVWPVSFVENAVGDLINFVQSLVTKFFRGIYHRIYDAAVAALQ